MSIESRYKIAPQMLDYDMVGGKQQWVPYLMQFCEPSCNFPSVTTNKLGFRSTLDRNGIQIGTDIQDVSQMSHQSCSVMLGGSVVFGVGATHDRYTIPSILNRITEGHWLNYGGRAFNSTQELIAFMLHMPYKPECVLLFSGVNNIVLGFLNKGNISDSPYCPILNQSIFEMAMKNPSMECIGVRRAARQLIKEFKRKLIGSKANPQEHPLGDDYQKIISCFRHDLHVFKVLAEGLGIPLYFALQPAATWIDKQLSTEEQELFDILDNIQAQMWLVLSKSLCEVRDRYFTDVANICANENIPFYNLNLDSAFRSDTWLFVDRVHMTDTGNALAAEIVKREFKL